MDKSEEVVKIEEAWTSGRNAFLNGTSDMDCPFQELSREWCAWKNGWTYEADKAGYFKVITSPGNGESTSP